MRNPSLFIGIPLLSLGTAIYSYIIVPLYLCCIALHLVSSLSSSSSSTLKFKTSFPLSSSSLMVFQNLQNRNVGAGQKSNHPKRYQSSVLP